MGMNDESSTSLSASAVSLPTPTTRKKRGFRARLRRKGNSHPGLSMEESSAYNDRLSVSMPGVRCRLNDSSAGDKNISELPLEKDNSDLDKSSNSNPLTDEESRSPIKRSSLKNRSRFRRAFQSSSDKKRKTPSRSKSGGANILRRKAMSPKRRSSDTVPVDSIPDLAQFEFQEEKEDTSSEVNKDSLNESKHNKEVTTKNEVTFSEDATTTSPKRRSKSAFRRTRSTPDTPEIRNSVGGMDGYEELSDSDNDANSRSTSPMRRSISDLESSCRKPGPKGTLSRADLAPRIPLNRGKSSGTSTPSGRVSPIHRARTLGSAREAMRHSTNASEHTLNNDSEHNGPLRRRAPPRRSSSFAAVRRGVRATKSACADLAAMQLSLDASPKHNHESPSTVKTTRKSSRFIGRSKSGFGRSKSGSDLADMREALVGSSRSTRRSSSQEAPPNPLFEVMDRATKSACAGLAAMQLSLDASSKHNNESPSTVKTTRKSGRFIGRSKSGYRRTKSGSDLADMRETLIGSSRSTRRSSSQEAPPNPLFEEMVQWNPLDPEDRAKYDDTTVKRLIRRNPDAVRAKYHIQVGRSTVSRSALSTLVALGASLDTIKAAVKAHPAALQPDDSPNGMRTTPLHTACSFPTDRKVVEYIYQKYPDAIRATTKHVFLPLHNACQMQEPSLEMIQFLVDAHPDALTEINKLGDTPLRIAERNRTTPPDVLEYLEEATERIFSRNEASETKRREIQLRQSWGQRDMGKDCADLLKEHQDCSLLMMPNHSMDEDTDHTTLSTLDQSASDCLTSEEFAPCNNDVAAAPLLQA